MKHICYKLLSELSRS